MWIIAKKNNGLKLVIYVRKKIKQIYNKFDF